MDVWTEIPGFPGYAVSNRGLVCNDKTGRILMQSHNQHGVVHVGLFMDGRQHKRSVAVLVANAFLPPPPSPRFNTPIHLNGNRDHNFVENLAWRPRPFAIEYGKQFKRTYRNRIYVPIENVDTGAVYEDSFEAACKEGLLERGVVMSVLNADDRVFPTGDQFRIAQK